jgi:predicted nucleotidyltransferase
MRLKKNELAAIKEVTKEIFGANATIRLFGSRTNDTLKGGDIDLLILCNRTISSSEKYQLKIKFLVQLKKIVGDQKIDVLIDGNQQESSFFKTVKDEGILL